MNEPLANWTESLVHWLAAWTVVVLLVSGWLVLLRPKRATVRYGGWLLATFAGAVLLPVMIAVAPVVSWQSTMELFDRPSPTPSETPIAFQSWFDDRVQQSEVLPEPTSGATDRATSAAAARVPRPTLLAEAPPAPLPSQGIVQHHTWLAWAALVWSLGVIALLARLAVAFVRTRGLIAAAAPPLTKGGPGGDALPEQLVAIFHTARRQLRLRRPVRLAVHPDLATPVCTGLFRPTVLWPHRWINAVSPAHQRAAMVHELAHLRRRDDWLGLAAELWRALCWPYLLVHWTLARLRREREFLCDDLAAAQLDRPESYARLLLDCTAVRLRLPALVSPFAGGSLMAKRIRRVLRPNLRITLPLSRRQSLLLITSFTLLLLGAGSVRLVALTNRAAPQERPDAPLPEITLAELGNKVAATVKNYDSVSLEAEFTHERDANPFRARQRGDEPVMVQLPGRFRYAQDGRRWRGEFESKSFNVGTGALWPRRWSAGFDGDLHYAWERPATLVLGEQQAHEGIPVYELLWRTTPDRVSDWFARGGWKIAKQAVIRGYRCYVVEWRRPGADSHTEVAISPRQGYLPVRQATFREDKLAWSHELLDLEKTADGMWFPRRVLYKSTFDSATRDIHITKFEINPTFADDYFDFELPFNAAVIDHREGIAYYNTPWWPDLAPMLRERFDWPRVNVQPLKNLGSNADAALDGKPAPPLQVGEWINGDPIELEDLRGKVTLLYFTSGGFWGPNPEWVAAIKGLYRAYQPLGLEVVEIETSTKDLEAAHQAVRELRIPWPVAIDTRPDEGLYGRTFQTYALESYLSPILVDHEGTIHLFERGKLIETLVALLRAAGADDVEPLNLESPRIDDEIAPVLDEAWHEAVRNAPATASISGTITDGEGPLPLADVEATLYLFTLIDNSPFGQHHFHFRDKKFRATAGADGTFELTGLTKGIYDLKITAPGKAWVHQRVVIKPDLKPASIRVVAKQPDGIVGQITDDAGGPIAGATVSIRRRHFDPDIPQRSITYRAAPAVTDAQGRFRFDRLQTGAYTLDINADGYAKSAAENIPAGTTDLKIVLKPSPPTP